MFEIINETEEKIEELDYLNNYISYVVKKEKLENCVFNIIFVSNEKIHEINFNYRGVDKVSLPAYKS